MSQDSQNDQAAVAVEKIEPPIIASIREEQKYTLILLSVLHEQLAEFDIGKTPDYSLMLEVMNHASQFPKRFNHKLKAEFIQKIIDNNPEGHIPLENLLAEQIQVVELAKEVINALKALVKEQTILRQEQLRIFIRNYVELLESHIETENSYLLETDISLPDKVIESFSSKIQSSNDDPSVQDLIEERLNEISKHLKNISLEELEEAATDFAFSEVLNISAFIDTLEPLSLGIIEMSKIIKDFSYQRYLDNYNCYKTLLTKKQDSASDYIKQPIECFIGGYKQYVKTIDLLKVVMTNTKEQAAEPYRAHKRKYKSYHNR